MDARPHNYSDEKFWGKLARYAKKAGRKAVEETLTLYYCMKDPETPLQAKIVIFGALAYLILPVDLIPDFIPVIGWLDDVGVVALVATWLLKDLQKRPDPADVVEAGRIALDGLGLMPAPRASGEVPAKDTR